MSSRPTTLRNAIKGLIDPTYMACTLGNTDIGPTDTFLSGMTTPKARIGQTTISGNFDGQIRHGTQISFKVQWWHASAKDANQDFTAFEDVWYPMILALRGYCQDNGGDMSGVDIPDKRTDKDPNVWQYETTMSFTE